MPRLSLLPLVAVTLMTSLAANAKEAAPTGSASESAPAFMLADVDGDGRVAVADLAPALSKAEPARGDTKPTPKGDARYGNWDRTWGAQPPAPPKHFTKQGDWYRHVRACQRAYKSYSPRSDTYRSHGGKTLRCRL